MPADAQFYTLDELREEMKKLAWVEGDYKIVPYGAIWGSAIYATRRTFPGFFILFIQSPTTEGEDDFEIDTRRTRLGLDVTGPSFPGSAALIPEARSKSTFMDSSSRRTRAPFRFATRTPRSRTRTGG